MIYNLLEKSVYIASRYEIILLLEDIQPAKENAHSDLYLFKVAATNYEQYIDICFPNIPYSEERLALFSHIYSNAGVINPELQRALTTQNRAQIWFALRYAQPIETSENYKNNNRCFYEADIFGLFNNSQRATNEEVQIIVDYFSEPYLANTTRLNYMFIYEKCTLAQSVEQLLEGVTSIPACNSNCICTVLNIIFNYVENIRTSDYTIGNVNNINNKISEGVVANYH